MERGVVYLSRIPPYMGYKKIRKIFSEFAEIENVFLKPEPKINRSLRKKHGGNTRKSFVEGWIEFIDKNEAKKVAQRLNNNQIGGKKRHNFYREDIWNIRYLPKFKWDHLEQKLLVDKMITNQKLQTEISLARKANRFFAGQVKKSRELESIETKKKIKLDPVRDFKQKAPLDSENK